MIAPPMDPALVELARQTDSILAGLEVELDQSAQFHRLGLAKLGMDVMGWTPRPHHPEAIAIWKSLLRSRPDDVRAMHHLAILHHARAFELEMGPSPAKSDADWVAALEYWHRILTADAFWDALAARVCRDIRRDPVDELRQNLPVLLLTVHFDIALDPRTRFDRARYHIRLALNSPFDPQAIDTARRNAYGRATSGVPDAVWNPEELGLPVIKQGTDAIVKYLEMDPGFTVALEDILRLQIRLMDAWITEYQARADDRDQQSRLLSQMRQAADQWRPYFDQLADNIAQLKDDVRVVLCKWYRIAGIVLGAVNQDARAAEFLETGMRVGVPGEDETRDCARFLAEELAYAGRDLVYKNDPGARAYCESVWARRDEVLSPMAHRILAEAYVLLEDFERAKEVCRHGIELPPDESEMDYEVIAKFDQGKQKLKEYLGEIDASRRRNAAQPLILSARARLSEGNIDRALVDLDEAARQAPGDALIYFLRCRCRMELFDLSGAAEDLAQFRALDSSEASRKEADTLESELRARQAEADKAGGPDVLRWRREATELGRRREYERGCTVLRRALRAVNEMGRAAVERELALLLYDGAYYGFGQVMENPSATPAQRKSACQEAINKLLEAQKLSPADPDIAAGLEQLQHMLPGLDRTRPQPGDELMLERDCGPDAVRLRREAISEIEAKRFEQAVPLLRWAIGACPAPQSQGKRQLERELAMALDAAAEVRVKTAAPGQRDQAVRDAVEMLLEAMSLDPENEQIKMNLYRLGRA